MAVFLGGPAEMSACVSHPQLEWKARDEVLGEIAAHSGRPAAPLLKTQALPGMSDDRTLRTSYRFR